MTMQYNTVNIRTYMHMYYVHTYILLYVDQISHLITLFCCVLKALTSHHTIGFMQYINNIGTCIRM